MSYLIFNMMILYKIMVLDKGFKIGRNHMLCHLVYIDATYLEVPDYRFCSCLAMIDCEAYL